MALVALDVGAGLAGLGALRDLVARLAVDGVSDHVGEATWGRQLTRSSCKRTCRREG